MAETHIEEIERLNPHFKWSKQKVRREVSRRARNLPFGGYAFGCRGHPGRIVGKNFHPSDPWGAGVEIKSLVDGNVESCSIFNCNPDPIDRQLALGYAFYMVEHGSKMAVINYFPESYGEWVKFWNDPSHTDSHKERCGSLQEYLGLNDGEFAFLKTKIEI